MSLIIAKTPLRISFIGGGTDLPTFYNKNGYGSVISTSIDKYVYIILNKSFEKVYKLTYSENEKIHDIKEIQHNLIRECFKYCKVDEYIELKSIGDIPSKGSGLGSSSAFTVSLFNALSVMKNVYNSKEVLAETACKIEIEHCKSPIGKQDQYAAAYGGLNKIDFHSDGGVKVCNLNSNRMFMQELQNHIIILNTGIQRSANTVLRDQIANLKDDEKYTNTKNILSLVECFQTALNDENVAEAAKIVEESWYLKKTLSSNISNDQIDDAYELARTHGAWGGKLLGAGNGGYLLLFAPPNKHNAIKAAIGWEQLQVSFDYEGARILTC